MIGSDVFVRFDEVLIQSILSELVVGIGHSLSISLLSVPSLL